ncbi:MAG TPA: hypothetical protein VEN81_09000, partial [Planctomycetota bacterium]|nr:hypothetical protein [Planctomycetota bacterium]
MVLRLIAVCALLGQSGSEELQKRVRVDGQRIYVDDQLLYDGPWLRSEVVVRDIAGWKHVIVNADGEERVRIPVRSIAKPISWPPTTLEEVRPLIKKLTEERDGKITFTVIVTTEHGEFPVYVGPPGETKVERTADAFVIRLGDKVIYRVSRAPRPTPRPEAVLEAVNGYRARAGLGKVRLSPSLSRACDLHAL